MEEQLKNILESWEHSSISFVPKLILGIGVLLIFFFMGRLIKALITKYHTKILKTHPDVSRLIASCIYFFMLLSGVFIALEIMGLEAFLTKMIASAGILGIVAGFALKDIASSAFAGFIVKASRPFKKGDWVQFNNELGQVSKITLMTTTMFNRLGEEIFIPNELIYSTVFSNFSGTGKRRIVYKGCVACTEDLDRVKSVAINEIESGGLSIANEPIDFYFTESNGTTCSFEVLFWIAFNNDQELYQSKSTAIVNLNKRFAAEKMALTSS